MGRENKKLQMEQHLYDVAIHMFIEYGFQKTTLIDIASEAQVSTRTLYKYFPTKNSILKKFTHENLKELAEFAQNLPEDMPFMDKILEVMIQDFRTMFGVFDVSYILHPAHDDSGLYTRFELNNFMDAESIYCDLFKKEQARNGLEPNGMANNCASIVMGVYRHCTDMYRFKIRENFNERTLRNVYRRHLEIIWPSLMDSLLNSLPQSPIIH